MVENLHFHVNQIPSIPSIILFGIQQMMICLSMLLVIPYYMSNMVCAGSKTIVLRVQMISATFVVSGIATILQSTCGLRLSILHGPSFAFLPALHTFQNNFPCDAETDTTQWEDKLQLISGSCLVAVLVMPFLGLTGLIGHISKFIGPISIVPMIILLTISAVPDVEQKMALHWISVVEFVLLIFFIIILEDARIPVPLFSWKTKKFYISRQRIFSQFPYLLGIAIAWIICLILTTTNALSPSSPARTDHNDSLTVLSNTPWVQVPLPGRYGKPKLNVALVCGFVASCFAAMVESIGDYNMCAKISQQSKPPSSSINRAFVVEGIGCILAATMGIGTGIVTYAENIAIMSVTKVTSRITMQIAGIFLIISGVVTKFAAVLALIPEPIIGGVFAIGVSLVNGVSLRNLQTVDLKLSRNLTIMGISIIMGLTVGLHFEQHPVEIGNETLNQVFGTLLTTRMLIGGLIAFVLDNVSPGATREQRGFVVDINSENIPVSMNGYIFPSFFNRFLLKIPGVTYLPILPSRKEIEEIEMERSAEKKIAIIHV